MVICYLPSNHDVAFARLLAQVIRLNAQFYNFSIKKIILENIGEFTTKSFNDYYMSFRVDVEHPIAHTHIQNGLTESLIKYLQLIATPLMLISNFLFSCLITYILF